MLFGFKTVSTIKKRLYLKRYELLLLYPDRYVLSTSIIKTFLTSSSITFRVDYISAISRQGAKKYCLFACALINRFFQPYLAVNIKFDKSDWICATDGSLEKKSFLTISRWNGA